MRKKLILFLIFIIALFLRFYQLGQNPPSLTWDEVAWGYNAYSLGIDGKDEFGKFMPYDYLESFGDFKPPVYAYLTILPVKVFGLNEFSTRFPSALFGLLTVIVTYFLVRRIFNKSINSDAYALGSSFLLAISPWHINLSRAAFEANVATFFLVTGVWLFLRGVQDKKWSFVLSAISFVLSIYTFNTARIAAPLLVLILAVGFKNKLLERKKEVLVAIIVGLILLLPTVKFLFSSQASLRFREVNIFSDIEVIKRINKQIENDNNAFWSKIIHNRRFSFAVEFVSHYLDNFSPNFLFIKGDGNPKFSTQEVGQLYFWEFPFLIAGFFLLFRKKEGQWWILPLWILFGVIPAATARETPHALRIEAILPTIQILVIYGLVNLIEKLNKNKKIVIYGIGVIILLNIFYYMHDYYANYPYLYSHEWQYGYKESISYVKEVESLYDKISISDSLGRPYIYYLFYMKTNPNFFRETSLVSRDVFGFVTVKGFGKYRFSDNPNNITGKKVLYIHKPQQIPQNARRLKEFKALNGDTVLVAYTI